MRRGFVIGLAALLGTCAHAHSDNYPSKPIRAIIPFGAGSATDVIPRIVFDELAARLGQAIIVENRGGAGGTIGAAAVAKADPDGYTLLVNSSAHTITPAIYPNLTYDAATDFAAVGAIGSVPNVLIIAPSKGIKTLAEYYFCPIATALPHIRDGRLLGLAVSSPKRASALPDVPTTLESGYPDSDYTFWIGVFAPAKTPKEIVEKLNRELAAAVQAPSVREKLAQLGVEAMPMSPGEFDAYVKAELVRYATFAKAAGLKPN
jgi:tripartite-type tricarboxylate transporter receptor subunit TctC